MVEARNSKFGMQMDPRGTNGKNEKLGQWGSRDPILELWDPLRISRTVVGLIQQNCVNFFQSELHSFGASCNAMRLMTFEMLLCVAYLVVFGRLV